MGSLAAALSLLLAGAAPAEEAVRLRRSEPLPGLVVHETAQGLSPSLLFVEADPARWEPRLLCASHKNLKTNRSAREWAKAEGLAVAVNAGMYQTDHRTSVGLLVAAGRPNNRRLSKYKAVLAFGPTERKLPKAQIIDRECQDFDALRAKYRSLLQGIRMIDCRRNVIWQEDDKRWPMAVLGTLRGGRLLVAFSRTALKPREFAASLLRYFPDLERLMYLEGGPPAQVYLKAGKAELEATGASGEAPVQDGTAPLGLAIPNVLGFVSTKS